MHPFAFLEPGNVARRDLRQCNECCARVAHVGKTDRIPGTDGIRLLAIDVARDVVHDRGHHGFDHVACLGRTGWDRRRLDRRYGNTDTRREDVFVLRVALVIVHHDKSARIAKPLDSHDGIHTLEGRQHHAKIELDLVGLVDLAFVVELLDVQLSWLNARGLCIGDPADMVVTQFRFEHSLGITDATKTQVTDVGLGSDQCHLVLVANLALAQIGVDDKGKLVGRPETASKGHGADDDMPAAFLQQLLVIGIGLFSMVDSTDRVRTASIRSCSLDLLECEARTGGNDEIVVVQGLTAIEMQGVALGIDLLATLGDEVDALALEVRLDPETDVTPVSPADGHPRIGWNELEIVPFIDDSDLVLFAQFVTQFIGCRQASGSGSQDNDMRHG